MPGIAGVTNESDQHEWASAVVGKAEGIEQRSDLPAEEGVSASDVNHWIVDAGNERRKAEERAAQHRVEDSRSVPL